MGYLQAVKAAKSLILPSIKKCYITPACRVGTAEQLGLKLEKLADDAVQITHKSPLSEFQSYMQGVAHEGKGFKPVLDNPDSAFTKYFQDVGIKNAQAKAEGKFKGKGKISFGVKQTPIDLNDFKDFIHANADKLNVSKEEYWQLVDELANQIKKEVAANSNGIRREFVDNADKIHKWAEIFRTQHKYPDGREVFSKYYDKEMFDNAVKEYIEFVEKITGKKVFVGCPSRMNFPISVLGFLNNPKAYKDVDFILLGHGHNSSLITDISHPDTWRFSDNNKSIWEYIENVCASGKTGKKGLVFCCETDGLAKAGKTAEEMVDNSGQKMTGIGNQVMADFLESRPAKIVESGIRHIKGHRYAKASAPDTRIGETDVTGFGRGFTLQPITEVGTVDYNLDFSKYKVENIS